MTSLARRDPVTDALLTPENSALLVIDYQATQIQSIQSIAHPTLLRNVAMTIQLAQIYHVPIVLSTVNVATGRNKDTVPYLKRVLGDIPSIDRTNINAWEDGDFVEAVKATGRKHLVMAALWTEACLTFPALDALREATQYTPLSTRSVARAKLRTKPHSGGWNRPALSSPPTPSSPANGNATGTGRTPYPTLSKPCSLRATSSP